MVDRRRVRLERRFRHMEWSNWPYRIASFDASSSWTLCQDMVPDNIQNILHCTLPELTKYPIRHFCRIPTCRFQCRPSLSLPPVWHVSDQPNRSIENEFKLVKYHIKCSVIYIPRVHHMSNWRNASNMIECRMESIRHRSYTYSCTMLADSIRSSQYNKR